MEAGWLVSAAGFALATSASPGPNNTLIAAAAARVGVIRALPAIAGVAVGLPIMLLIVGAGLGATMRAAPLLMAALRWVGAAWLLWLAWQIFNAPTAAGPGHAATAPPGFLTMIALQWLNPKAWLITATGTLAYAGGEQPIRATAALAALFAVAAVTSLLGWAALGAAFGRWGRERPTVARRFNVAMAGLLIVSVLGLLGT